MDRSPERSETPKNLYSGAAGVIWALEHLHAAGHSEPPAGYDDALEKLVERDRADTASLTGGRPVRAYLTGDVGILLVQWRRNRNDEIGGQLFRSIERNARSPARGFLWGASGTMFAARWLFEVTGEARWAQLYRSNADALWEEWRRDQAHGCHLWTNELYGFADKQLGALHGFAGNAGEMLRGQELLANDQARELVQRTIETLQATALADDRLANWPMVAGRSERPGSVDMRVQHCMGAPGVVSCLATLPRDTTVDSLLSAAGELIWTAGPPTKVPCLCHGTPGNGYAFLKLFVRTGDERWLERARRFAMHSIGQSEQAAERQGPKHSLWTGDLGVACYLSSCILGSDVIPTLDTF